MPRGDNQRSKVVATKRGTRHGKPAVRTRKPAGKESAVQAPVALPVFDAQDQASARVCPECRALFFPVRSTRRTCGDKCRQARSRRARSLAGVKGIKPRKRSVTV